jgi:signal transduction histidine kinase
MTGPKSKLSAKNIDYLWRQAKDAIVQSQLRPSRLHSFMRDNDIEVVVRLKAYNNQIGMLVLGPKRDGDTYSIQDVQLLEIGSKNIAIAISDALKYEEIAGFNRRLMDEIATATEKLKRANLRLQELDKTKDAFISAASHQLRPQLTAAQGFLAFLKDDIGSGLDTEQKQNLSYVSQSLVRMIHIVEDLLDIAVMAPYRIKLKLETVQLVELVKAEIASSRRHGSKTQPIRLQVESQPPTLQLDAAKTREVIANLLENAKQYSRGQGDIVVRLRHYDKTVELSVTDQGIGVSRASQAKLFDKFFRTKQAKLVRPDGTGIGLYVAKSYVEAQGGQMSVTSKPGHGATIGFSLPAR